MPPLTSAGPHRLAADRAAPAPPPGGLRPRPLALFVAAFAFFLLTGGREPPWNDARPIHEVAESLLHGRGVAVQTRWPYSAPRGRDGKLYAAPPVLPSLVHVPGVLVHHAVVRAAGLDAWLVARALTSHVGPAACGALVCVLFFLLCAELGLGAGAARAATAALALGTTVWVYARSPFSEIVQAACFLGLFLSVLRALRAPTITRGAWLGAWGAALVNTKLAFVPSLAGAALLLAVRLRREPGARGALVRGAAGPLAAGALVVLAYNHLRWGSPLRTGYELAQAVFGERLAVGLWGLFLSPGKSIFLYSPPLVLAALGLPALRRRPEVGWALLLLAGPVIALHAKLLWWSGDWAWGPRYVVFAVPALLAPACLLLDDLLRQGRRLALAGAFALAAAGAAVQALGIAFYWDHHVRIAQAARASWLGEPDRNGSIPWRARDACDPCFEDLSPMAWLPPFQPLRIHAWLLPHVLAGRPAEVAARDGPWRAHTRLPVEIGAAYARVRLDWWFLELRPLYPTAAWALLAALSLVTALASARWALAGRAPAPSPAAPPPTPPAATAPR